MAKIRNGFVSNSSSSSFIVKLDKPIEEYTLDEFRTIIKDVDIFDPIKQLYNDLRDTENSRPELDKFQKEYYGINELQENEYIVYYGNECDETYGHGSEMEYDFMPYIENSSKIQITQYNMH